MSKDFNFDEFLTETITLKSRGYSIGSDMGLTTTPATKESGIAVSMHRLSGNRYDSEGTMVAEATHYAIMKDTPAHSFANGDIVTDSGGVSYEIIYYEHVESFIGDYDGLWLKEVRQ